MYARTNSLTVSQAPFIFVHPVHMTIPFFERVIQLFALGRESEIVTFNITG